ncbi:MAG: hypothetical protein KFH98_02555 [Gemmatimonadetes bacterium]|nr:hypothetical protein [Gemmatimonadota bacterium]
MKRAALAIGFLLPALASCDPVLSPDDVAGEYVLQGTPVILELDHGRITLLADTLRLSTDGTATRVVVETYESGTETLSDTRIEPYRYTIRRGRVELAYVCPINALMLCTPPPHMWGPPNASGLALRAAIEPAVVLQYDRLHGGVRTQ